MSDTFELTLGTNHSRKFNSVDSNLIFSLMFKPEEINRHPFRSISLSRRIKRSNSKWFGPHAGLQLFFDFKGYCFVALWRMDSREIQHVLINPECDSTDPIEINGDGRGKFTFHRCHLVPVSYAHAFVEEYSRNTDFAPEEGKWDVFAKNEDEHYVCRGLIETLKQDNSEPAPNQHFTAQIKNNSRESDRSDELYENRIRISPYTTVELDFHGSARSGSCPKGQRFAFVERRAIGQATNQIRIFDGPNIVGSFEAGTLSNCWGAPQVHPAKALFVMISTISVRDESPDEVTVNFCNFAGQALHSYTISHGRDKKYKPAFGFTENGSFFYAGAVEGTSTENYELIVWDDDLPLEQIGNRNYAAIIEKLGAKISVISGETQLQDGLYFGRHKFQVFDGRIEIRPFRYLKEGKIEFLPELTVGRLDEKPPFPGWASAFAPICFSYDQSEVITTWPYIDSPREIRRLNYHSFHTDSSNYNIPQFQQIGESSLWPFENEGSWPRNGFYVDPVRVLFKTDSGRLLLLHTRSLTVEAELEIAGFELDTVLDKLESPSAPRRRNYNEFLKRSGRRNRDKDLVENRRSFCSDIEHIRRCGDDLLLIGPKGANETILGFIKLDDIVRY